VIDGAAGRWSPSRRGRSSLLLRGLLDFQLADKSVTGCNFIFTKSEILSLVIILTVTFAIYSIVGHLEKSHSLRSPSLSLR
jgi:hypothetical protein